MNPTVKCTKSGIPIPLDSTGQEMCLLFIKYGRCRFKSKCKKSHWKPPLPDEPYPEPPPLPCFHSWSSFVTGVSALEQVSDQEIYVANEQWQNSGLEASFEENKITCLGQLEDRTTLSDFNEECWISYQRGPEFNCYLDQTRERSLLNQALPEVIQSGKSPTLAANSVVILPAPAGLINVGNNVENNTEENDKSSEDPRGQPGTDDSNVTRQENEIALHRISQVIYKKWCRFDFVYYPNRQSKGSGYKFKSSIDLSYQQYGAYYNHITRKLEFHHLPRNKVEKKNVKLLRRAHWNTCQELKARLVQVPPGYSVKVDFSKVNITRLRPYFFLLVHQCFFYKDPSEKRWKPNPFSCLVAETLIALFTNGQVTPVEAETKMEEWGGRPVKVRQCISHMWNIIVKSSLSPKGVAEEVLNCESKVFAKKFSAMDYAYACSLSRPLVKGSKANLFSTSTPTITKSVRQGICAAKEASSSNAKTEQKNLSVTTSLTIPKSRTFEAGSRMNSSNDTIKGSKRKEKRRKTKRSEQISLLNEQGKQDLLKRCEAILADGNAN